MKVPLPYKRGSDEAPEMVLKFSRGSNNGTRATYYVYRYGNGTFCVQLEDQTSGAEIWMKISDLKTFRDKLTEIIDKELAR